MDFGESAFEPDVVVTNSSGNSRVSVLLLDDLYEDVG